MIAVCISNKLKLKAKCSCFSMSTICLASKNKVELDTLKEQLKSEFEMKDMGQASKILGIDIKRDMIAGKLFLTQEAYIDKLLEIFNMVEAKPVTTPLAQHFKLST